MKFENTYVSNFKGAFKGLRNPLESWSKSDSAFGLGNTNYCEADWQIATRWVEETTEYDYEKNYDDFYQEQEKYSNWLIKNGILQSNLDNDIIEYAFIGPKDMDLAQRMIAAGTSDRKFLRQISVSVDITAPLYWWKEFDTYKIGTVANSTSTMHKLASTPITLKCFETDDLNLNFKLPLEEGTIASMEQWKNAIIDGCESLRKKYLETKDKKYWKELIRWLPEGWLQTRTVTLNYEVLRNIYFQRQHHKLSEWHQFCDWILSLPYATELITYTK